MDILEIDVKETPLKVKIMFIFAMISVPVGIVLLLLSVGFTVLTVGLGIVCGVLAGRSVMIINMKKFTEPNTIEGVIVSREDSIHNDAEILSKDIGIPTYKDVIEYVVDGKKYYACGNFSRGGELQTKIGDKVVVTYDKTNPERTIILDDIKPLKIIGLLFFVIGIITMLVGLIILFFHYF